MPTPLQKANLPASPFDGQEFIDFRGLKWKFSTKDDCWRSAGIASDAQIATAAEIGLLSPTMKRLLDTLPEHAGGFGILARPLLSVVPLRRKAIYKGTIYHAFDDVAGSQIKIDSPTFTVNAFAGKLIFFSSGVLKSKYYVIFTNSDDTVYVMGKEASQAKKGDKFEILEATAMNEHGVIQGNIELLSETLDISCVTGSGEVLEQPAGCSVNRVFVDDPENPPGLDIRVSKKFLDQFCIQIPGCVGPNGVRGPQGPKGKDGTGDGPKGDKGVAGKDATTEHTFTGIKINDIDDVYDTAVVVLELDAGAGKLHVVKAKIKVPDNNRPAERVIATAINRDLRFTDTDFEYEILMPGNDPINVKNIEIMHYPQGFTPPTVDSQRANIYEPNVITLSSFVDALVSHYKTKLDAASSDYDNQIKPFIEQKDTEARKILSELADEVSKCEWDMPIEFCLGITPENCKPDENGALPFPLAETLLGPSYAGAVAIPLPEINVPATPTPDSPVSPPIDPPGTPGDPVPGTPEPPDPGIVPPDPLPPPNIDLGKNLRENTGAKGAKGVITPSSYRSTQLTDSDGSTLIRASAIVFLYAGGAARSEGTTWTSAVSIDYHDQNGDSGTVQIKDSDAAVLHDFDKDAFISAQVSASEIETAAVVELSSPGEIRLSLVLDGQRPTGNVKIKPYQVFTSATMKNAPIPITQSIARAPDGTQGLVHSGEADCPQCPDCSNTVDCGNVNCPDCPPDLTVVSVSPTSGPLAGNTLMTILGTGFGTVAGTVTVGGSSLTGVIWGPTSISGYTPSGGTGSANIVVIGSNGASDTVPNGYEYVDPRPEIASISPASGDPIGIYNTTISGTDFGAAQGTGGVTIGGQGASIVSWSDTSIVAQVPPSVGVTAIDIVDVVVTTDLGVVETAPNAFTYYVNTDITSVTPGQIVGAAGGALVIVGTYFGAAQGTINIGGQTTVVTSWTDTGIGFNLAPGALAPGQYQITITRVDNRDSDISSPGLWVV